MFSNLGIKEWHKEYLPVVASMVTFILTATGIIRPEDASEIEEVVLMGITAAVTLILSIAYILSRTEIKKEAIRNKTPEVLG